MIRAREQDTEYGEDMATKMSSWNKNRCVHAEKEQEIEVVGQLIIDRCLNERLDCALVEHNEQSIVLELEL